MIDASSGSGTSIADALSYADAVIKTTGSWTSAFASTRYLQFNFDNPLVRRLAGVRERTVVQRSVQMLYIQALLLGHHPLSSKEMKLLNDGLLSLIEWGIRE